MIIDTELGFSWSSRELSTPFQNDAIHTLVFKTYFIKHWRRMKWAVMSLSVCVTESVWVLGENIKLLQSECFVSVCTTRLLCSSLSRRGHTGGQSQFYCTWKSQFPEMKSPPDWITWGEQATAAPQGPLSVIGGQVLSHGLLNSLGGSLCISRYDWKDR